MRNHARRIGDGSRYIVFQNRGVDCSAHASSAARCEAAGHVVKTGNHVSTDQHAVARFDVRGRADAGAHFGIADDHGDRAGDASGAGRRRARDGDDDSLVARGGGDDHILARVERFGDQLCVLTDEGKHLVFKYIDVDRRAHRRAAGAAGSSRKDDHLLDFAVGVDGHAAGRR